MMDMKTTTKCSSESRWQPAETTLDISSDVLTAIIDEAAHLLPQQAPLNAFVHHNTLHYFEDLNFDEAVVTAGKIFKTEPYHSEAGYLEAYQRGRIRKKDFAAVIDAEVPNKDQVIFAPDITLKKYLLERLTHEVELPTSGGLSWWLHESDALKKLHPDTSSAARAKLLRESSAQEAVKSIWKNICKAALPTSVTQLNYQKSMLSKLRFRDHILAETGLDTDADVHPLVIRMTGAFLDQGLSYWVLPNKELGLWESFREIYGQKGVLMPYWAKDLPVLLAALQGKSSEEVVLWALGQMGVEEEQVKTFITETLLVFPGWPGMVRQLEERPDKAPVAAPPCRLVDFLAFRLVLDFTAGKSALARYSRLNSNSSRMLALKRQESLRKEAVKNKENILRAEVFFAAQWLGIRGESLEDPLKVTAFIGEIAKIDALYRRRISFHAYERQHRIGILDPMLALNAELKPQEPKKASFQAFFCIDDREESLRRHIEEVSPEVQTFGYAGFYAIPMSYRGISDTRIVPLCPVSIRPKNIVIETLQSTDSGEAHALRKWQPARAGSLLHSSSIGSTSLVRGSLMASVLGIFEVIPLVGRILFPKFSERFHLNIRNRLLGSPEKNQLIVEQSQPPQEEHGLKIGFTVDEMAEYVAEVLISSGVKNDFSRLVFMIGHGSSSLNNPHEAAYDCGACAGGRGGPNGRAFAIMANHKEVRKKLKEQGINIKDDVCFIGGYHHTANNNIDLYDTNLVPESHRAELKAARVVFDKARANDAQERARRFPYASLETPESALAHVQARAVDIGQARPEYGHSGNAICVVGRRALTRGLFLDRRAFLVSYDPSQDDEDGSILDALLQSVAPVGAGINLEYYFSYVDNDRYGAGSKLPHNITGLLGVINGPGSDLRTGLYWQMVEIHEPMRLLTIVEASPERLLKIAERSPVVGRLVKNQWIQLVSFQPEINKMHVFTADGFIPYEPEETTLKWVDRSIEHCAGKLEHLPPVGTRNALLEKKEAHHAK